jgi:hypothetical protein
LRTICERIELALSGVVGAEAPDMDTPKLKDIKAHKKD